MFGGQLGALAFGVGCGFRGIENERVAANGIDSPGDDVICVEEAVDTVGCCCDTGSGRE